MVLWRHYGVEESTWEREDTMRNVKPDKNSIFLKKSKTIISVENWKFSRSRMMKRTASLNSSHEI